MDYEHQEHEKAFIKEVEEFIKKEIEPVASEIEEEGVFKKDIYQKLGEIGYLGAAFPQEYGGRGFSFTTAVEVWTKLAQVSTSLFLVGNTSIQLVANAIYIAGSEEQKKRLLPSLLKGEIVGAFCLTEPESGSDVSAIETVAEKRNDEYFLKGKKVFITNAPIADVFIAFAKTKPDETHRGITAFIVERNADGLNVGTPFKLLGAKGAPTSDVEFTDCLVREENILGEENRGFYLAMQTLELGRLGMAAYSLGIASACLNESVKRASERKVFGKTIGHFEDIGFTIAEMKMWVDAAKMLLFKAAWLRDIGDKKAGPFASMAKLMIAERATEIAKNAVQIHGGYGCIAGSKVERLYRDAKLGEIMGGTNEIQRRIIFQYMLREYGIEV